MTDKFEAVSFIREMLTRTMQDQDKLKNKVDWLEWQIKNMAQQIKALDQEIVILQAERINHGTRL